MEHCTNQEVITSVFKASVMFILAPKSRSDRADVGALSADNIVNIVFYKNRNSYTGKRGEFL